MYFKLKLSSPATIAQLLGISDYPTIAQTFATIPASVVSLNLSGNDLGRKIGAELAEAFAALPADMTSREELEKALISKCLTIENELKKLNKSVSTAAGTFFDAKVATKLSYLIEDDFNWVNKCHLLN
jgi:hypothetical protein